jgi:hypothetical protein
VTAISAQSRVLGTDNKIYKCIHPHTSTTETLPTTGNNWQMVWELGSGSTTSWATSTKYTAAESLRIVFRRPIFDFDKHNDTPDFPMQFHRLLLHRLALDLADSYPATIEERTLLQQKIRGAFNDIFPSTRVQGNDIHNKVKYF